MGNSVIKGHFLKGAVTALLMSLAGCTTINNWFLDDEEIEIRTLEPIDARFSINTVWEKQISGGFNKYFSRLRPALGYDLVFAANRHGTVAAYDEQSGKRVWERDFATFDNDGFFSAISNLWASGVSAKIAGGLAVSYEKVYFGTEDGLVFALNAKTGETVWQSQVKGEVIAAPAIDENVVLFNTGSGVLFALDAATGEPLWSYESDVPALTLRGISAPTANNGGAIVGTASGKLVVNIINSGQTAWEQAIAAPSGATELERIVDIDSQPIVVGGVVYVISFDGTLAAVEFRSGRVMWKREYKSYLNLAVDGNTLFVTDVNSNVYAIDRRNGVELWSQSGLKQRQLTAPEPVPGYIVVGDGFGFLHWIDKDDGKIAARIDLGGNDEDGAIYVSPLGKGNRLFVVTREGQLFAVEYPLGE